MIKSSYASKTNSSTPKYRIDCLVSKEVKIMWDEIVKTDAKNSKKRHYPAHTFERLVRADYEIMKAFYR